MSPVSWRLVVRGPARRNLERLPEKAAAPVFETLEAVAKDPYRVGKPLRLELEGLWSARRGPYRVIYRVDEESRIVTLEAVGHRADIYRRR